MWLLIGVLVVLLIRNNFDMQGVGRDIRKIAREIKRIAKELAKTIRQAVKEAKQETKDARKVGHALEKVVKSAQAEAVQAAVPAQRTVPVQAEPVHAAEPVQTAVEPAVTADSPLARVEPEMTQPKLEVPDMDDPELQLNMAAILANVPTLDFPKDDPKYDSVHRKYLYA